MDLFVLRKKFFQEQCPGSEWIFDKHMPIPKTKYKTATSHHFHSCIFQGCVIRSDISDWKIQTSSKSLTGVKFIYKIGEDVNTVYSFSMNVDVVYLREETQRNTKNGNTPATKRKRVFNHVLEKGGARKEKKQVVVYY